MIINKVGLLIMKVAFYTLGCKVNQYETQVLIKQFKEQGCEIVKEDEIADVYIINSCTVTSTGDKKTRQIINRLKSQNKEAIIVLSGCFPQAFPQKASKIKNVDIITGTKNRFQIYNLIKDKLNHNLYEKPLISIENIDNDKVFEKMEVSKFYGKTRAFVKIQDGCNSFCSYCIIPKARGRIRSKPLKDLYKEVLHLADNGHKEIVLTGINLSSYGQDFDMNIVDAVKAIEKIDKINRIRLSSLEPDFLTEDIIYQLSKIDKFCPHFHLCLQSGCDDTLKRMNRHYSVDQYYEIVKKIREYFENPSITTDVMVGFPGETDQEFSQSFNFIKKVKFARMHVFSYSKREGTRAAIFNNQVPQQIKHQRSHQFIDLSKKMQQEFLNSQKGLEAQVLFETSIANGVYQGYSKNYTLIIVKSNENICGKIKKVKIIDSNFDSCNGFLLE